MNGYKFEGIINGFTLDENLIDGNVICDIDKQISCVSSAQVPSPRHNCQPNYVVLAIIA